MVKSLCAIQETQVRSLSWEASPGEENGYPGLQDSCLENSMDRGAWWTTVHGVKESDTTEQLSLCSFVDFLIKESPPFSCLKYSDSLDYSLDYYYLSH